MKILSVSDARSIYRRIAAASNVCGAVCLAATLRSSGLVDRVLQPRVDPTEEAFKSRNREELYELNTQKIENFSKQLSQTVTMDYYYDVTLNDVFIAESKKKK